MLKIQVNGHGMIPRGLGIAPRKEPFPADRNLIYTILQTPGLSINYLHPENGKLLPLTRENMKTVLDKYQHSTYEKTKTPAPVKPHIPEVSKQNPNPVTPPPPPAPPAEPPKPVVPQTPEKKNENAEKLAAPETKDVDKKDEPKGEEKKPEDKKPEEKKDEKSGGMMPIPGKGQNAQTSKNDKK